MLVNITTRKTPRLSARRIVVRCFLYLVGVFPRLLFSCYFSVLLQHRHRYHPRCHRRHRCPRCAPQHWQSVIPTAIHVMEGILIGF